MPERTSPAQGHERNGHKRVAFISGNFNVIHAGHMRLLKFAADYAERVIVGLNPDTTPGVTVPLNLRIESVRAISMVHQVIELPKGPVHAILELKPDFVIKGKEFEHSNNPELEALNQYGGKLIFGAGEMRFSSMDLIEREFASREHTSVHKPSEYPHRHGFKLEDLRPVLDTFAGLRVLVIGDLIVDEYVTCDPLGMSREDPTIVVTPINHQVFVGGAGIVSAHARGLGARVNFITVAGNDSTCRYARDSLKRYGVEAHIFRDGTRPTTLKRRYRASGKTLLRLNELRQHAIDEELQAKILTRVKRLIRETDLLLFSDFNYGCLPQDLVNDICMLARRRGIPMAADSQASSQLADISRYRGMILVTPTEHEARLALQDSEAGLAVIASSLRSKAEAEHVLLTMGAEGLLIVGQSGGQERLDQLPAFNHAPKDVAGAGDSVFTCTSMALCAGHDIWQAAYLGSIAAAIQVSRVGNKPIQASEIIDELTNRRGR